MPFRNYFLAAIIINVGVFLSLMFLWNFLPPLAPLFYGRPVGEAQLTKTLGLFLAPGTSLLITVLNLSLSFWVKDSFFRKLLAVAAIVVAVLTAITIVKIIVLVGFF